MENVKPDIIKKLFQIFFQETHIMNTAINIEKEKNQAILQAKSKKLIELSKRSDELLNSLIQLETQRYSFIENLIESYKDKIYSNEVTISNFIKILYEIQNDYFDKLQYQEDIEQLLSSLEKFKQSANELKQEVEINQKLLLRTKNIISNLVESIEKRDKTYGNSKNKKITSSALLINQSI